MVSSMAAAYGQSDRMVFEALAAARQSSRIHAASLSDLTPSPDHADQDPLQAILPSALPAEAVGPQMFSPTEEVPPVVPSLDSIVGAQVNPTASVLRPSTSPKTGPGLKLPSFHSLGIANAHSSTARRLSEALPIQHQTHLIETLTPPDERTAILWHSLAAESRTAENLSQHLSTGMSGEPMATDAPAAVQLPGDAPQEDVSMSDSADIPRIQLLRSNSDNTRGQWLMRASEMIVTNMRLAQNIPTATKILSHALPCPSPQGFAFPYMISSLQMTTPGSPVTWISVFHALPGKINLSDLPTSPPSTPGPSVGGADYFTSQTFDSAVHVLDYQENLDKLPRTPHPVVPPCTIGVSVLERYIPPSSANEFRNMFEPTSGRSLLVDRLVELSPDNGSLLFIYPTKAGAETFMRSYLGPLIDPLLRTMRIVHNLPFELAESLGSMPAVNEMLSFDMLKSSIEYLLLRLSRDAYDNSARQFSNGVIPKFELALAQSSEVMLEREVWAQNWWVKQEKTRVRAAVKQHFPYTAERSIGEVSEITATSLVHSVLDGVATRQYPPGREPMAGVEVGVFVIKRTA